jgi:succinoglycan biosynthesis transport protein ExoP
MRWSQRPCGVQAVGSTASERRGVPLNPELDDDQLDIRRLWAVLWSRAPMIIGLVIVAAAVAYGLSSTRTDLYRATTTVRVVDPNSRAVFDGAQIRVDPERDVDTQLQLLRSNDLRLAVEEQLAEDAELISSVSASAVSGADLIEVSVSSPDPAVAQAAANALAEIYVEQRKSQEAAGFTTLAAGLRDEATQLDEQIAVIDGQLAESELSATQADVLRSQRQGLVNQQAELRALAIQNDVEAATRTGNVEIAESASLPTAPYAPTPARDAALAGILALLVGVGLAFLSDRLDDRIKGAEDVERVSGGAPVLGAIPIHGGGKRGAKRLPKNAARELVPLSSPSAEAYRTLRTSLRFSSIDKTRKTIVVTSSDQSEGKSTVAANLAVVMAESGLRVVLVSADLRRPSISGLFGITDTDRGLTTVLLGDAALSDCLQRVQTSSGQNLYVLPSGPLPQNPAELLGSKGMRDVISTLENAGVDYLLIDTPPVLPVSDAMAVAQFADGVLVLTVADQTKKAHLAQTIERLRQVNADVIGVVVNGIPTRKRYGYYGGYGYGYGYGSSGYLPAGATTETETGGKGGVRLTFTSRRATDQHDSNVKVVGEPEIDAVTNAAAGPTAGSAPAYRNGNGPTAASAATPSSAPASPSSPSSDRPAEPAGPEGDAGAPVAAPANPLKGPSA